jgi:hypothetical protein
MAKGKFKFPHQAFPNGWPYSSSPPNNRLWRQHRDELFEEHGNGWWYTAGVPQYDFKERYRKRKQEKLDKAQ